MKKKLLVTTLTIAMMLSVFGCGKNDLDYEKVSNEVTLESDAKLDDAKVLDVSEDELRDLATVEYDGVKISAYDNADDIIAAVNTKLNAPESSTGDKENGRDFYYIQLHVSTDVKNGEEFVSEISSTQNLFKTTRGIGVDSTYDEVKSAYGEASLEQEQEDDGIKYTGLRYEYGDLALIFTCQDGVVITWDIYRQ